MPIPLNVSKVRLFILWGFGCCCLDLPSFHTGLIHRMKYSFNILFSLSLTCMLEKVELTWMFKHRNWEFPDSLETRFPFQWHVVTTVLCSVVVSITDLARTSIPLYWHSSGCAENKPRILPVPWNRLAPICKIGLQGTSFKSSCPLKPYDDSTIQTPPIVPPR